MLRFTRKTATNVHTTTHVDRLRRRTERVSRNGETIVMVIVDFGGRSPLASLIWTSTKWAGHKRDRKDIPTQKTVVRLGAIREVGIRKNQAYPNSYRKVTA